MALSLCLGSWKSSQERPEEVKREVSLADPRPFQPLLGKRLVHFLVVHGIIESCEVEVCLGCCLHVESKYGFKMCPGATLPRGGL